MRNRKKDSNTVGSRHSRNHKSSRRRWYNSGRIVELLLVFDRANDGSFVVNDEDVYPIVAQRFSL